MPSFLTAKGRERRQQIKKGLWKRSSRGFVYEYTLGKKRDEPLPPITNKSSSVRVTSSELESFIRVREEFENLGYPTVSADCMGPPDLVECLGVYHFAVKDEGAEEDGTLSWSKELTSITVDDPDNQGQYSEMIFGEIPNNATMRNAQMVRSQILSCEHNVGINRASSISAQAFACVDCLPITEEHDFASNNRAEHKKLWETAVQDRVHFLKDVIGMFKNLKCLILHGKWAIKFVLVEHRDVFLPFLKNKNIAIPQGDIPVFHDSLLSSWKIDMVQARHYYETYSKAYACMMGLPTPVLDIYKVVFVFRRYIKEHVIYEGYYNGVLTLLGFSKGNMQKLMSDAGMTGDAIGVSQFPSQEQILEQGNAYMVRGLELRLKNVTLHNVKFGIKNQSSYNDWKRDNAGDQVTVNNMINQVREQLVDRNVNEGDEEEEVEGITDEMMVTLKGMKSDEW